MPSSPSGETQAPRQEVTCPRSHTNQGEAMVPTPTRLFPEKKKLVVRGFRGEKLYPTMALSLPGLGAGA